MLLFIQDWVRTTEGYVPIPIRKVAAKESRCEVLIMSRSQPTAEVVNAPTRRTPRDFKRSDNHPRRITDTPAQAYTGMVMSWVSRVEYPKDLMMTGKKLPKVARLTLKQQ
jgi:hypothetical protein